MTDTRLCCPPSDLGQAPDLPQPQRPCSWSEASSLHRRSRWGDWIANLRAPAAAPWLPTR